MFVMELACYDTHLLNQQVTLKRKNGWVLIVKEDFPQNGIHRLVLGLKTGDFKVGRHLVDGNDGKRDNRKRVLRSGSHASNMGDINRKTATSSSKYDGVTWNKSAEKWHANIRFSNKHVKFQKNLGYFGTKGDKTTGESEASEWREKVKEHVERINEELKDITDRAEFKRKVNDEIKKLR